MCHNILCNSIGYSNDLIENLNDPSVIAKKRRVPVRSVILEAELLVFNEIEQRTEGFGGIRDFHPNNRERDPRILKGERHMLLVYFDILHLNGESLVNRPLCERRRILNETIQFIPNYSHVSSLFMVDFSQPRNVVEGTIKEIFNDHRAKSKEGLIIKRSESPYIPRNDSHWLKMKHACKL